MLKRIVLSAPLGALLLAGCAIGQDDNPATGGGTSFAGDGGTSASGGSAGGLVAGGGTGGGEIINPPGGSGGSTAGSAGSGGGNEECASEPYEAKLLPLDMFIMMDRSGSMAGSRWTDVKQAVNDFVSQSVEGHVGVGLGFFPSEYAGNSCSNDNQCGAFGPCKDVLLGLIKECDKDMCYEQGYASPVAPIQPLPGGAGPIQTQLNSTSPSGGTPMAPALRGAIQYAQSVKSVNPTHITSIILVSDGFPEGCGSDDNISVVANAAAAGLAADIQTFVVGIGDELSNFDQIAIAGGTSPALIIGSGTNVSQALTDKLEEIRGSVECSLLMPEVPDGETADFDTTNVNFTPDGGTEVPFPRAANEAACVPGQHGYYFDDPANPTMVHLCPFSCDFIKNNTGQVDIVLGCEPLIAPPPE